MDEFKINKVFITHFLKGLWNCPEVMYQILINSTDEEVKANLAPFIVNDFYCNYLSGNYMENNLLYVITLMLKDEIDKLEKIEQIDTFLENNKCGFILEELQKMPDIQIYFKKVIFRIIENIERNCSSREISFDVSKREKELIKIKELEKKKGKNKKNLEEIIRKYVNRNVIDQSINFNKDENNKKSKDRKLIFAKKYVPDIVTQDFESHLEAAKNEGKKNLEDYYNQFINDIKNNNNQDLYSNKTLMKNLYESEDSTHLLTYYRNDFLDIISFINLLLEDLFNNTLLMPNSIKYICKIIYILINKKFKNISQIEINALLSKFLLGKLLIPIISSPDSKALISDFVISENTIKNINIITNIISKLFSGKLYLNNSTEGNYAPFNLYFFEKMEDILNFFEKILSVNLPNFIYEFINKEPTKLYLYKFFNENKEELYANISICFSMKNIFTLIKGLEKAQNILEDINDHAINKLMKAFKKLKDIEVQKEIKEVDMKILNKNKSNLITKKKEKEKEKHSNNNQKQIELENYYIFNSEEIEDKYGVLFSINNKIANFYIDIQKMDKSNKLEEKQKNLIKVKNYLCNTLGNYRLLNKQDFSIQAISDIIQILNEIKAYMSLPNFIVNNNTIPSIWYINSILDYLKKIPEEYIENDYQKLFSELTKDLNDQINILDFEKLILFRNKIKFIYKMINYYENVKVLKNDININLEIKKIAEQEYIPIDINFEYGDEQEKIFEIKKSNIKDKLFEDKIIIEDPKKGIFSLKTIEAFTRHFPNLTFYQIKQGINPIDIIKELNINEKINIYFDIIKEDLTKIKKKMDVKKYEDLYKNNIKDYIMNKIYDKIYPPEPEEKDTKIFQNAIQLSWVEPNVIVGKDYYIYDNILPDILNEFGKIKIVKSPYKKLNCIKKIIQYTTNLIQFNEGIDKEVGADDINPVLNYIFIKAHPFGIYTDIEFIKSFIDRSGDMDCNLTMIEGMYSLILNSKAENFNLTPEEYQKKCKDATNEQK